MKYLVKELAHKYIPQTLLDRPKMGFAMPLPAISGAEP